MPTRHSKNNTAGPVFTYNERNIIKNKGEYGEITKRLNSESQKKLEHCSLCLTLATSPVSCTQGHIFCRSCIIENLVHQKEEIKQKHEKEEKQLLILEKRNQEKNDLEMLKKQQQLKELIDGVLTKSNEKNIEEIIEDSDVVNKIKIYKELSEKQKEFKIYTREEKMTKCFWVPENTPFNSVNNQDAIAKKKKSYKNIVNTVCPMDFHNLKYINLINVRFNINHDDKACCSNCKNEISYQKVFLFSDCGDIICNKCLILLENDKESLEMSKDNETKRKKTNNDENYVCMKCCIGNTALIQLKENISGYVLNDQTLKKNVNINFKC